MSGQWSIYAARLGSHLELLLLLLSLLRKTSRILLFLLLVFLALVAIIVGPVLETLQSYPLFFSTPSLDTTITVSPFQLTDRECKRYGFQVRRPNTTTVPLPIYDFFLFHNELDMLEIRLYELYNYVTLFLIIESRTTLSGKHKPLYLKENWLKFDKYHDKIRRFEVDLDENATDQWANEAKMRREGLRLALHNQTTDVLLLTSDVDEIPKAQFLHVLSACQLPNPFPSLMLVCAFYYYSFEFRYKSGASEGPTVSLLLANRANRSTYPSGKALRDERFGYRRMPAACYHCSWCFDRINLTRAKMASYSHTEHNRVEFQAREHILARYRHGKDLFDRPGEEYEHVENNDEVPELVKAQPERFLYMINRSKLANIGFRDA